MLLRFNKIITALALTSFLIITLFGFVIMTHGSDGHLTGNCLFSDMGPVICSLDTVTVAIQPGSVYRVFLNLSLSFGLGLLVIFSSWILPNFPLASSYNRKITHWLSLKNATL